jgi:hypothetical protein
MQTAQQIFRNRLLKTAVEEAARYPRALCNQHCKTHLYFKDGIPYEQLTGEKHDCIMTRIAKMFIGHYGMVRLEYIKDRNVYGILSAIENAEKFCARWSQAFDNWKATGRVPTTEEVEAY